MNPIITSFILELEKIASKKVVNFMSSIPHSARAKIIDRTDAVKEIQGSPLDIQNIEATLKLMEPGSSAYKNLTERIAELKKHFGPADVTKAIPFPPKKPV